MINQHLKGVDAEVQNPHQMADHPHHQEETYNNQHHGVDVHLWGQGHQNLNSRMDHQNL